MIRVVTDSAASLPSELVTELGIEVVSLYLTFGEETLRDGVDVADFYGRLARGEAPVTTSTPSPGDFLEAFDRSGADEIVCVTVASTVSAIYQTARLAAEQSDRRVEVVDSGSASMAEGFAALEAARAARDGAELEEVAGRAKDVASRARVVATIDTFEYLQRSGRVSRLIAFAASKLQIKPVFEMRGGRIEPVGRPRTRGRALDRVVSEALSEMRAHPTHVAAIHAAAEPEARRLLERVSSKAEVVESYVVEFTPAMGAHTGPGVVGLAYFCE